MSTELETKLKELRGLMVVKGDVELVDECIALASVPQQDVGAGRSVPSPVGQAQQQNSDVLGECHKNGTGPSGGSVASEGDPLSAAPNVPFAPAHIPDLTDEQIMLFVEVFRVHYRVEINMTPQLFRQLLNLSHTTYRII